MLSELRHGVDHVHHVLAERLAALVDHASHETLRRVLLEEDKRP